MYGFTLSPEHQLGQRIIELADKASVRHESYASANLLLPDNRQAVVKVYKPSAAPKPDPSAP